MLDVDKFWKESTKSGMLLMVRGLAKAEAEAEFLVESYTERLLVSLFEVGAKAGTREQRLE